MQAALEALSGNIKELAFDAAACRVVQRALEKASLEESASLAQEMDGHVLDALRSPHANHVITKIVEILPVSRIGFVFDELTCCARQFARHRYGCRVLSRLVEQNADLEQPSRQMECLIGELLLEASELSRHAFGHYVIEAILQYGGPDHVHRICNALRMELLRNAKNRCATYVVEKTLLCCDEDDQKIMIHELFASPDVLIKLVDNQFGCHVGKTIVRFPGDHALHIRTQVEASRERLQTTKYGRRLLDAFEQRSYK